MLVVKQEKTRIEGVIELYMFYICSFVNIKVAHLFFLFVFVIAKKLAPAKSGVAIHPKTPHSCERRNPWPHLSTMDPRFHGDASVGL